MADKPTTNDGLYTTKGQPVYLEKKGSWWWCVQQGNRTVYSGPYDSWASAERFRDDPDAYAASGWAKDDE
jgi:hypothetical protein